MELDYTILDRYKVPRKLKKDDLSWFDIKKYDLMRDWTLAQWIPALMLRFLIQGCYRLPEAERQLDYSRIMFMLMMAPGGDNSQVGPALAKGLPNVWDVPVIDLYEQYLKLPRHLDDLYSECKEWLALFDSEKEVPTMPSSINKSFDKLMTERGHKTAFKLLFVNLQATDEQVVSDFQDWLVHKRAEEKMITPSTEFSERDIKEWARYQVMAYIDLDLFCRVSGQSMSLHTIGQLLFPNEYDVDLGERIRKVVRPLARKLMSSDYLSAIDEQVARAERKKKSIIPE